MNTLDARIYLGAGDSEPNNQVAKIPPAFVCVKAIAMAVARRICGAVLLAVHVGAADAPVKTPVTDRNNDPY